MKVLVLGAAGKTGSAVVRQAVASGHQVTSFVRRGDEYQAPSGVLVAEGDATNGADIERAVAGQEAVIDTIGGKTPYKSTTLESSAAAAVIASMRKNGVRRLIATSMIGVGDSEANATVYERLLVAVVLRGAEKDKSAMEANVEGSGLDWTIVRPAILNDDAATGNVEVIARGTEEKAHKITRADLARFLVGQISSSEYTGQTVVVANS